MDVRLAYGSDGLEVVLPDSTVVVEPVDRAAHADPHAALVQAVRHPVSGPSLRELARPGQHVAVSVCDITRPQPREAMLRVILEELEGVVRPADVTVIVATGTHRASSAAEIEEMLGTEIPRLCSVVDHDARDRGALVDLGSRDDVPVYLNRLWVDADLRITTGFVEPHFFAGFSGGPKMIAPGLAGLETTLALHNARRIGSPRATWGICEGNPVHDSIRAVVTAANAHFSLDVLLNARQQITRAFGGSLFEMHAAARTAAREDAMTAVDAPFDVVVTTNSGYPLDRNLYQSVKGMSAAAEIVKQGGAIICAAECRDGVPDHGGYAELLRRGNSPRELLEQIEQSPVTIPDQWQVQIQARVQQRARVYVHSDGLSAEQLRSAHLERADDISLLVSDLVRRQPEARVCALPQGPQTIAYVA